MRKYILILFITPILASNTQYNSTSFKSSGNLSPTQQNCSNITACIKCEKQQCYKYDFISEKCEKDGQNKTIIIILHIFFGLLGVAAFVVGNNILGFIQLSLICSPMIWVCCYSCPFDKKSKINDCLTKGLIGVSYIIAIMLWIWYLILIINDSIMGKNGCPLIE